MVTWGSEYRGGDFRMEGQIDAEITTWRYRDA